MKTKTVYVATDGREFDRYCAALSHQQDLVGEQLDDLLALLGLRDFDGVTPGQRLRARERIIADPAPAAQALRRFACAAHALFGLDNEDEE